MVVGINIQDITGLQQDIDNMVEIKYTSDGWVCHRYPYDLDEEYQSLEITESEYQQTLCCREYYAWRVVDGKLELQQYEERIYTSEERLQERIKLHEATDDDFAKYSRQVRCNVDMPHSQQVLDYIDQYNLQVSDTVNQPNFPQEVTYPEYHLP